ncbi:MAG: site-specific integrase [Limnohabitans sp.]|nr:site-specific integrase [Limnohabitans sp.]
MASIVKTPSGTYKVLIRKRGFAPVIKTFDKKADAQHWAKITEAGMATGQHVDFSKEARSTTVGDLFQKYLNEMPPVKNPEQQAIKVSALFKSIKFMDRHLDQISSTDIQKWRDARLKDVKPGTVIREMGTLSGVFNYAINEWHTPLAKNPVTGVSKPQGGDVQRTRGWEDWEVEAVLKASNFDPNNKPSNKKDYAGWAIALAIETAMRKGEMLKVTAADFHPNEQRLFIKDAKNGYSRSVPLTKKAISLLTVMTRGLKPDEKIFPLSASWLAQTFDMAKKDAGLTDKELILHGGRHEATTRASAKLAHVLELTAFTGHRDLRSVKRYYNPKPSYIADKLG